MTTLALLRHAKSSYPEGFDDFDRPLAPRGIHEAQLAGAWLRTNLAAPDRVVVSPALRAVQTWELADTEVEFDGPLTFDPRVYEATSGVLLDVLHDLPDRAATAILVGHNPGLEVLVRNLARTGDPAAVRAVDAKYPTSAIAVLSFAGPWRELEPGAARLETFEVPR